MKPRRLLAAVLTLVTSIGIAVPAFAAQNALALQEMDQYIDEDIVGVERDVMQEVLLRLDPEDRENVVYIAEDGSIYSTSTELKDEWVTYELNDEGKFENDLGEEMLSPFVDTAVESEMIAANLENYMHNLISPMVAEGGEGPYRRVGSNTGYSWMSGYLTLPASSNVYVPNGGVMEKDDPDNFQKDTPYAYFGGTCSGGKEIDAGMMYNGGKKNWSLFIAAGENALQNDTVRFRANQKVFLKYYVSGSNEVTVSVEGTLDGSTGTQKRTLTLANATGWNTSGNRCSLKHVVSMAQGDYENFKSGAYVKGVKWSDIYIGTSSANNAAWTASYGANIINYPTNKQGLTISYTNPGNETVSIDLT